eukprot:g61439.t1
MAENPSVRQGCLEKISHEGSKTPMCAYVYEMEVMFFEDTSSNQNLNAWDISQVVDMRYMFFFASSFRQNLSSWNTSQVGSMSCVDFGTGSLLCVNLVPTLGPCDFQGSIPAC